MIYAMSDIHGEYEKFIQMLKKIEFGDDDTLFILGDVLDRGDGSIKHLEDVSLRPNVFTLLGNHEVMALDVLDSLLVEITDENCETHIDNDVINKLLEYQLNGGDVTLKQFKALDPDHRFDLVDYLKDCNAYDVIDVGDKTFILSHTGCIDPDKPLAEHTLLELTFTSADENAKQFDDPNIYIIAGHTPTLAINGKAEILRQGNRFDIDCGATFGGKLACLRLDDFKEFYV